MSWSDRWVCVGNIFVCLFRVFVSGKFWIITCCSLCVVGCSSFVVRCSLFVVHGSFFVILLFDIAAINCLVTLEFSLTPPFVSIWGCILTANWASIVNAIIISSSVGYAFSVLTLVINACLESPPPDAPLNLFEFCRDSSPCSLGWVFLFFRGLFDGAAW